MPMCLYAARLIDHGCPQTRLHVYNAVVRPSSSCVPVERCWLSLTGVLRGELHLAARWALMLNELW